MNMRVAVQMDPIQDVNIDGDTSFALMEEAQARGASLWVYQPEHLSWCEGRITCSISPKTLMSS